MTEATKQPAQKLNKRGGRSGMSAKEQANLLPAQWKPGESGNKAGYSLKSRLDDAMGKPLVKPPDDAKAIDHLVYATLQGAIAREPTPFREVWDRTEGKVPEKHALALLGGIDLVVRYIEKGED